MQPIRNGEAAGSLSRPKIETYLLSWWWYPVDVVLRVITPVINHMHRRMRKRVAKVRVAL